MNKSTKYKLGLFLIIFSIPIFIFLMVIPFLNMGNGTKITLSTILLIIAEASFWIGGLLLGKELFAKYKAYLNPKNWRK